MNDELLRGIPGRWATPPAGVIEKKPVGLDKAGRKAACRICGGFHAPAAAHLDYVGHADITLMLIDVDPCWVWAPAAFDEYGGPRIAREGGRLVMWGTLTVGGKTLLCVGTCDANQGEPEKELIGDLLRNGAMRFGIGTRLWSKAERDDSEPAGEAPEPRPAPSAPQRPPQAPSAGASSGKKRLEEVYHDRKGLRPSADWRAFGEWLRQEGGFDKPPFWKEFTDAQAEALLEMMDRDEHGAPDGELDDPFAGE